MSRFTFIFFNLAFIVCVIATIGCTSKVPIDYSNDTISIDGHVYLNDDVVAGAQITAISANGIYHISNVTDKNGSYVLYLPNETQYNLTASYRGLKHTIWPVVASSNYDIYLMETPHSFVMGQGVAIGGLPEADNSKYPFNSESIVARAVNDNDTIVAKVNSNGKYALEVNPNVQYQISGDGYWPIWLNYRNRPNNTLYGGWSMNFTLGEDETVLIDFRVIRP